MLGSFMVRAGKRSQQSRPKSSFSGGIIIDGEFEESDKEQDKDIESIEVDKDDTK
jgi:hypothetical protein